MNSRQLLERRAAIVAEMRSITNEPKGKAGDLSKEQSGRFDELKTELEGLEQRISRQQLVDEAERRMQGETIAGTGDDRFDEALRGFSLRRAIVSQIPDLAAQIDCGRERELSAELAKRAGRPFQGIAVPMSIFQIEKRNITSQAASPDSGGANLVATDFRRDQYIDALYARLVLRRLGATVLGGLTASIDIPKLSTSGAASWIADDSGTGLTQGDPTFAKVSMAPKHCGCLTEYSRGLVVQASPDVENMVRMDFARVLAGALDIAGINGSGGNDPTGVLNVAGVDTTTVTAPLTWAKILQLIEILEDNSVDTANAGWIMSPGIKRLLRSTAKVTSTDSVMIMQDPNSLAGYQAETTANAPLTEGSPPTDESLIFGYWPDLLIGLWSELDVLVNPYESGAYNRGAVKVRAMMSVDIAVRHTESFAASQATPG